MKSLLSVRQVAYILKVHPLTIRRYIKDGKLKAIKVGGNVRIEESVLNEFHNEVTTPSSPTTIIMKTKKQPTKVFTEDDPFLRLKGRGASLTNF